MIESVEQLNQNERLCKELKKIKCCVGQRFTTGYNTSTGEQKPSKNGKTYPVKNMNLYDIICEYILTDVYRKTCWSKAAAYNAEHKLEKGDEGYKKPKEYAASIYAFEDYRYTKYDDIKINEKVTKVLTNKSFLEHKGLMGFDIDFPKDTPDLLDRVVELKEFMFNNLKKFRWLCMVTLSTSGKGIHIYTYNDVPDEYSKTDGQTSERIAYFNSCYQYKVYEVYKLLYSMYKDMWKKDVSLDFIFSLVDFAMYKPEQTLNITVYDGKPLINESFECEELTEVKTLIKNGYKNWIHREGQDLKPNAEAGWGVFTEEFCKIGKFLGDDRYNIKQEAMYIRSEQPEPVIKGGPWYFGHSERHDGIPTMHEICKYLLATREYPDCIKILESKFYSDGQNSDRTCEDNIKRLLDWYNSRGIQYTPDEYVCNWLNKNAGFKDKIKWNPIDQKLVGYFASFRFNKDGFIDSKFIDNYILYLNSCDIYKNKLRFNVFTRKKEYTGKQFADTETKDYTITDADLTDIRNNFNRHMNFTNRTMCEDAIDAVCRANKYNPIQNYLESLEWDGTERIPKMFTYWLGAEDTPLIRRYAELWMHAAVKRIYQPGCKFDNIIVARGIQGDGKTEFFMRLGLVKYATCNKINLSNKDYINRLNSNWIVVMDELASLGKKEMDEVKSFFSTGQDEDRLAYARDAEKYMRHCVFVGTTNKKEFLRDTDDMYERRFWVFDINCRSQTFIYDNFGKDEINELWAEAYHKYKENPDMSLYLGEQYIEMAKEQQRQYKSFNVDDKINDIKMLFETEYVFPASQGTYKGKPVF